jgi:hypothetical protein
LVSVVAAIALAVWYVNFSAIELEDPANRVELRLRTADRNLLRVQHFLYPSSTEQIGRIDTERLAIMYAVLDSYRSGWLGRGYPHAEVTRVLGPTILREHAPAAFIVGDFGHLGALTIALAYLAIGALPVWRRRVSWRDPTTPGALTGTLCLAAFATSSLYMLAANYGWVLFTGKNMYLLGLDSMGDLLEGTALLVAGLFAWRFK